MAGKSEKKNVKKKKVKSTPSNSIQTVKPVMGRPRLYSKKLADEICKQLSEGKTLTAICLQDEFPCISTVMSWLWNESEIKKDFLENYTRAREQQCEVWSDEVIDVADDSTLDETMTEDGRRLENREFVSRSKLRVETRLKLMGKRMPKKYGEKTEQTIHHVEDDNFINAMKDAAEKAWSNNDKV